MSRNILWLVCTSFCVINATDTAAEMRFHSTSEDDGHVQRFGRMILEAQRPGDAIHDLWRSLRRRGSSSSTSTPCTAPKECILEDNTRCEYDTYSSDINDNISASSSPTSSPTFKNESASTPFPTWSSTYTPDNSGVCTCDCSCTSSSGSGTSCTKTCMDKDTCDTIMTVVGIAALAIFIIGGCVGSFACYNVAKRRRAAVVPKLNPDGTPMKNADGTPVMQAATADQWVPAAARLPGQGATFGGPNQVGGAMQPINGILMQHQGMQQHMQNVTMQQQQPYMQQQQQIQQPMQRMQQQQHQQQQHQQQSMQGMYQPIPGGMQQPMQGIQQPLQGIPMQQYCMQPVGMQQPVQGMTMQQPVQGMTLQQPVQATPMYQQGIPVATPFKP